MIVSAPLPLPSWPWTALYVCMAAARRLFRHRCFSRSARRGWRRDPLSLPLKFPNWEGDRGCDLQRLSVIARRDLFSLWPRWFAV